MLPIICSLLILNGIKIYYSGQRTTMKKSKSIWISLIIFLTVIVIIILLTPAINIWGTYPERSRFSCESKLKTLYNAFIEYSKIHEGVLPDGNSWCDDILNYLKGSDENKMQMYVCISDRLSDAKTCSYSMNQNLSNKLLAQVPGDVILLYESNDGWNSSGGSEKITFANHDHLLEQKKCGVLFANGKVLHVYEKDLNNLRWKP